MQPTVAVFIEPTANTFDKAKTYRHAIEYVQETLRARLPDTLIEILDSQEHAPHRVRAICASGVTTVVAAGSDKLVHAVAQALVGTPVRLGVLPLGNALHEFATTLQIPLQLDQAIALLETPVTHCLDVGCVNQHFFVQHAWLGWHTQLAQNTLQSRRGSRLKMLRELSAVWKLLRPFPVLTLVLATAGHETRVHTKALGVGTAHCSWDRSGIALSPHRLTVLDFNDKSGGSRWAVEALTVKQASRTPCLVAYDSAAVEDLYPPFTFQVVPQALWVIAPVHNEQGHA